jgi:hypothetical protein
VVKGYLPLPGAIFISRDFYSDKIVEQVLARSNRLAPQQ